MRPPSMGGTAPCTTAKGELPGEPVSAGEVGRGSGASAAMCIGSTPIPDFEMGGTPIPRDSPPNALISALDIPARLKRVGDQYVIH